MKYSGKIRQLTMRISTKQHHGYGSNHPTWSSRLLQEQEWLDHAADVMAARRLLAKEEARLPAGAEKQPEEICLLKKLLYYNVYYNVY